MHRRLLALASILASTACTEHAPPFYNITDEAPATDTTAVASFPDTSAPELTTTDAASETATTSATGASGTGSDASSDAGSSSGAPENAAPEIFSFSIDPPKIVEPGPVKMSLDLSDDVETVELWHGATLLATVAPADLPFTFDVTSQGTCQGSQTFTAIASDPEGLTDSAAADPGLFCELPYPGDEHYTRYLEGASGTAVAFRPDGGVVIGGVLGGRMMLWRLDADGNPVADWPKTIADWTLVPDLAGKDSGVTAVAVGPTGAIVVAGYYKNGIALRRYVATLTENGALLGGEDVGLVDGEEILGLAVSTDGDIVAGGSRRTTPVDEDPLYDAVAWGYPDGNLLGADRWAKLYERPVTEAPDPMNKYIERARAVLVLPNGQFAVIGERAVLGDDNNIYTRAFVVRFSPAGDFIGQWTSDGAKFANDAALAGTITQTGFAVVGWCRQGPNTNQQTCIQTFETDLSFAKIWPEPSLTGSSGLGIAQDREKRLVVAGFTTKPGHTDAWIFASRAAGSPLVWEQSVNGGGWDFATALACEEWGKCTWVGTTEKDGKISLVASQRWP